MRGNPQAFVMSACAIEGSCPPYGRGRQRRGAGGEGGGARSQPFPAIDAWCFDFSPIYPSLADLQCCEHGLNIPCCAGLCAARQRDLETLAVGRHGDMNQTPMPFAENCENN